MRKAGKMLPELLGRAYPARQGVMPLTLNPKPLTLNRHTEEPLYIYIYIYIHTYIRICIFFAYIGTWPLS